MSNFKKIFMISSAVVVAVIIALIVTLSNVRSNVRIDYSSALYVHIFNHSTVAMDSKKYQDEDGGYDDVISKINEITNVTALEKLLNRVSLDKKIVQDADKQYVKWSTDLKNKNIVIEFTYDKEQDLVVYKNGKSRVISYWCLALVIPSTSDFTEIIAYYSNTNETTGSAKDESYASCEPLVLYGDFAEFYEYMNSL